eukprot:TRINITY_DN1317_c0_g1_i4.p1 TRINITY_DN1317_c0_g1~~TRINITY_DN1317_c0_g1_i4.p1  ORF type:complete len:350 (+),score=36.16 TRINITY_DN1317_c0_g1_i4:323-1372(+)
MLPFLTTYTMATFTEDYKALQAVWPTTGTLEPTGISNTYGPRQKNSEGYRYDWHRGVDIPCSAGEPVYSVAEGEVVIDGVGVGYENTVVQVKHGVESGVFYTNYMHVEGVVVTKGANVTKGQKIAGCGKAPSGFYHVHFEVRESGLRQQNCIHPLRLLPWYNVSTTWNVSLTNDNGAVKVTVVMSSKELYLSKIEVLTDGILGGYTTVGGRDINPPFLNLETTNFQYTHTSPEWPAASCPFVSQHPVNYTPNVHTDLPSFNNLTITPGSFSTGSHNFTLEVTFDHIPYSEGTCFTAVASSVPLPQRTGVQLIESAACPQSAAPWNHSTLTVPYVHNALLTVLLLCVLML